MESTDIKKSRKAALDFLKIGRKKEHKNNASNNEKGIDLYYKYKDMSDDDFNKGLQDGSITPEQVRKAGEYAFDVYMGDVWSEGDHDMPEPSYDEFMANPAKYDYTTDQNGQGAIDHIERYNPARYKK